MDTGRGGGPRGARGKFPLRAGNGLLCVQGIGALTGVECAVEVVKPPEGEAESFAGLGGILRSKCGAEMARSLSSGPTLQCFIRVGQWFIVGIGKLSDVYHPLAPSLMILTGMPIFLIISQMKQEMASFVQINIIFGQWY